MLRDRNGVNVNEALPYVKQVSGFFGHLPMRRRKNVGRAMSPAVAS
jgi:hypothetical protein